MIVFGVDPSSTTTGFAVLESEGQGLIYFGKLKLTSKQQDMDAYKRIDIMRDDLYGMLDSVSPEVIVIETTSGHVGRKHKGNGAGLAIYGWAGGVLWATAEEWIRANSFRNNYQAKTVRIPENEWTRSQPKLKRTANIKLKYPAYNKKYGKRGDGGGDVADAIGIAEYYCNTLKLQGAKT